MKIKIKRVWIFLFIFLSIGLIGSVFAVNALIDAISRSEALKQMNSPEATEEFFDHLEFINDMNSGITLESKPFRLLAPGERDHPVRYSIWIINHSDEPIVFSDTGFGVKVFTYDPKQITWQGIEMMFEPDKGNQLISPYARIGKEYGPWILDTNSLIGVDQNKFIRVIVWGIGNTSTKVYGAYKDLELDYSTP